MLRLSPAKFFVSTIRITHVWASDAAGIPLANATASGPNERGVTVRRDGQRCLRRV